MNEHFTKRDIKAISLKTGITVATVERVLNGYVEHTLTRFRDGHDVIIPDIGKLRLHLRTSRPWFNAHAQEYFYAPDLISAKFTVNSALQHEAHEWTERLKDKVLARHERRTRNQKRKEVSDDRKEFED